MKLRSLAVLAVVTLVAGTALLLAPGCGGGSGGGGPSGDQARPKILLAGFDDLPDTLNGIRDGSVKFCLVQRTYKMGWLSVEKLIDACNGKELPKQIDTGVLIVDKANVGSYMQDMKKEFEGKKADAKVARKFIMVPKGVHPYYTPCYDGFQAAAAVYGIETDYCAAKEFQVAQQVQMIENVIARKVDGIAISALDDQGLVGVIDEATKAGIKVITFDAPAPSSKALCYIGTANEAAGYAAGEAMAKLMGNEGEIAVLQGGLAAPNLNDRYKGFEKALKEKAPNIKIVSREDTEGKSNVTADKVEALLKAYPKLKAIFAVSAEGVPGAVAVLKEQKRVD